jgi:molecular chaperone DnaK
MWSWMKSLFDRGASPVRQLESPAAAGRARTKSPAASRTPHALPWRKQSSMPESEFIYTDDPSSASGDGDLGPVLGIDLGTTHSVVAIFADGKAQVIPNQEGQNQTPSVVALTDSGEILVGLLAQQAAFRDPSRAVCSVKRMLGRTAGDVRLWAERLPFEVATDSDRPVIRVCDRSFTAVEILAAILGKLKDAAERHLDRPARRAVITVPAFFTDAQRQAVLSAAELAGFDIDWVFEDGRTGLKSRQRMRIISEPVAAALSVFSGSKDRKVVVLHMGGGTFDITVLDVGQGVLEVKSVGGDTCLGGDDFDEVLAENLLRKLPESASRSVRNGIVNRQRLRFAAERAKRDLSHLSEVTIDFPWAADAQGGSGFPQCAVTRAEFEQWVEPLIERCQGLIREAIRDAGLKSQQVNEVLVIGGMTRMPRLGRLFDELFPGTVRRTVTSDENVALGAAIQGHQLLLGPQSQLLVLDVTPLTLGVESAAGHFVDLIRRNTTIPTRRTETFTVDSDNQPGISVRVLEEEHRANGRRRLLGQLDLTVVPAPRTKSKVEVTFDLDANGILRVTAKDLATGNDRTARMVPRLSTDLIEARRHAELSIRSLERLVAARRRQIVPTDETPLHRLLDRCRQSIRSENVAAIRKAKAEVDGALEAVSRYLERCARPDDPGEKMSGHAQDPRDEGLRLEL